MKKKIFLKSAFLISIITFCLNPILYSQKAPTSVDIGEKMFYRISFNSLLTGNLKAGEAVVEVKNSDLKFNDGKAYHAVVEGGTSGLIELFYKVNDRFESYISEETNLPYIFIRDISENKYKKSEKIIFDRKKQVALNGDKVIPVPHNVLDLVTLFYFIRNSFNFDDFLGKDITVPLFLDDKVSELTIKFLGTQDVKTKFGRFNCIAIKPMVLVGNTFDESFPITVYVTNDDKKVPVLIESKLRVGRMRVELMGYNRGINRIEK